MDKILVSVCVTTYNHDRYIEDCLISVLLQQSLGEVEILVGDDCSTDNTAFIIEKIMRKFPSNLRYFKREKNIGACQNLKDLVASAKGDFIAHLDGDDFWLPGKLNAQINFLRENNGCSACYSNAWVVSDDLTPMGLFNNRIPGIFDLNYLLMRGNFLNHSSIFYRSEFKGLITKLPDRFIDYRIHMALASVGMLGYLNIAYVVYRHSSTQSLIKNSSDMVRHLYLEALVDCFEKNNFPRSFRIFAAGDFFARIIRDSISKFRFNWFLGWVGTCRCFFKKDVNKIFFMGFVKCVPLIFSAVIFKILSRLFSVEIIKVFNAR